MAAQHPAQLLVLLTTLSSIIEVMNAEVFEFDGPLIGSKFFKGMKFKKLLYPKKNKL